ncbi:RtcB family protein [bacterium]|nr:RtcB family protein [bacterium]
MRAVEALERLDAYCWRLPKHYRADMRVEGRVFVSDALLVGLHDDLSLEQCANVATLPGIQVASLAMPDIHQGYGFPIGGVAAMALDEGVVSPGGVGFDINCGVRLLATSLEAAEVRPHLDALIRALAERVPSGAGRQGEIRLTPSELDAVLHEGMAWTLAQGYALPEDLAHCEEGGRLPHAAPGLVSETAKQRGKGQLGTLGAGNHFLEVQWVEEVFDPSAAEAFGLRAGQVVVMIHCGSRGLGHQVATDYIRKMGPAMARAGITLVDRQLACAPIASPEGEAYLLAMAAACNFAWANRQVLASRTREVFARLFPGAKLAQVYDVAHNIAKLETHRIERVERPVLVHRKGATRAFPAGHPALAPAHLNTGQPVFIPGDMGRYSYVLAGLPGSMERSFGSCCHGAGRVMSRTEARGRQNFYEIEALLASRGVVARAATRSGITEEAPDVYKDVSEVVRVVEGAGLAKRVVRLRPMGVVKG